MESNPTSYSFQELKRKVYLFSLPLVMIATIIALFIEGYNQRMDLANMVSLPILWLTVFLINVALRKKIILMEILTFIFLCIFHLYRFYFVLTQGLGGGGNDLDEYTFWIPLFYI